ncbi:MAG: hypothetical protein R2788_06260 [Saprospiraceae bacterium]
MKYFLLIPCLFFLSNVASAQFQPSNDGLIIKVSDGTDKGRDSKLTPKGNVPTSYDKVGKKDGKAAGNALFTDPIVPLGMTESIQAAAFLERPQYGLAGFFLIFCVNDSIGGQQGTHSIDGTTYKGVFRLIRQKTSAEEEIPAGMTSYIIQGTFYLLGISY